MHCGIHVHSQATGHRCASTPKISMTGSMDQHEEASRTQCGTAMNGHERPHAQCGRVTPAQHAERSYGHAHTSS